MKKTSTALVLVVATLAFIPALAEASNPGGDFSGGVAIGTSYAGVDSAPTNGLIVQGNVGIGTTSPGTSIDVENPSTTSNIVTEFLFQPNQPANSTNYLKLGRSSADNDETDIGFDYISDGSTSNALIFGFYGTVPRVTIQAGGNVGIGNTPSYPLDVTGSMRTTQALLNSSAVPTLSTCGISPPAATAGSNNNSGQFTLGTGATTACTVTLANAYPNYAYCTVTPASSYTGTYYISAQSKSAFTVTLGTGTASVKFNYTCGGN
jgi:hypothetical protein